MADCFVAEKDAVAVPFRTVISVALWSIPLATLDSTNVNINGKLNKYMGMTSPNATLNIPM